MNTMTYESNDHSLNHLVDLEESIEKRRDYKDIRVFHSLVPAIVVSIAIWALIISFFV